MANQSMTLGENELRQIGEYVRGNLPAWMEEISFSHRDLPVQLVERMVRVEEELKAQRELMAVRFSAVDRKFEDTLSYMEKRFDAVDKRFDAMNKRFALLQWFISIGVVVLGTVIALIDVLG